jgi:hypothetical protein
MADELENLVERATTLIASSGALFGFVFKLAPDSKTFIRGRPIPGVISDAAVLARFYKPIGDAALEVAADDCNQGRLIDLSQSGVSDPCFCVIISKGLSALACVAAVYRFYDEDEAVRTLRLIEMIPI